MTYFSRIFHPIGQGAFYSEKFVSYDANGNGSECRVVYDCGSWPKSKKLKATVSSAIPDKKVNILFLSHFHADHLNGIEHLDPQIIIIPLLDKWDKAIFWLSHELKASSFDKDYEVALRQRFPKARIIRIQPLEEGQSPQEDVEELALEPLAPDNTDATGVEDKPSGTIFALPMLKDWIYIPLNPKLDSHISQKFNTLINDSKEIKAEDLLKLNSKYVQDHKDELLKIYEAIGNPNEYSMVVYSGPNRFHGNNVRIEVNNIFYHVNLYRWHRYYQRVFTYPIHPGCLYLGDINLKEQNNGHSLVLRDIYKALPTWVKEDTSTIQVPHHGSKDNYNTSLRYYYDPMSNNWEKWRQPMIYVISFGRANTYGHPAPDVISDLMTGFNEIVFVTDASDTLFIEKSQY